MEDSIPIVSDSGSIANRRNGDELRSSIGFATGLVIKVFLLQINLLINPFTFPIWLLHCTLFVLVNPLITLRHVRESLVEKILWISKGLLKIICPKLYEKLKRMACGIFWSFYVLLVLSGLLLLAFLVGSMIMQGVVEEPVMVKKDLSFDYTKASPDAFVELGKLDSVSFYLDAEGEVEVGKHADRRFVQPNRKLKLTVSLLLPESDYNWKLGVFQVKAEFLSREGRVMGSLSHPCMLRFKSSTIRYLGTFIMSGYLLAGHSLESQALSIKLKGFTQGTEPTTCIRVILQQRAEHNAAAAGGIPEIYAASLKLESELPLFEGAIWNWRRTVFIWVSMGFFILEVSAILVCYSSIIIPKAR